jgi:hypothetical protein
VTDRERRIGQNESLFRSVNEQIEGINKAFAEMTQTMDVVCECADLECLDRLLITMPAYDRVRSDPTLFVVIPGHELPDVEDIVEQHNGHFVIRKRPGAPQEVAVATDPRARA